MIHKLLPFGTYQYCVTLNENGGGDGGSKGGGDCLYRRSEDQFMISLVDPENDAKLYEYNPVLSWIATYSFSDLVAYGQVMVSGWGHNIDITDFNLESFRD